MPTGADVLGIVSGLRQRSADVIAANPHLAAKILGKRVYVEPKSTRITVDCRTGERTIEPIVIASPPMVSKPAVAPTRLMSAKRIVEAARTIVEELWGIDRDRLMSRSTKDHIGERYAVYRLLRRVYGWSLPQIGRMVDRDHSSIIAGLKRAK